MLRFTNAEKTGAIFDGSILTLAGPEDWHSIGDGPTREAVLAWLDEGNEPEDFAPDLSAAARDVVAQVRAIRTPILSILDGLQVSAVVTGDTAKAQAIEAAKASLRDITALDLSACATPEEMQHAFKRAYAAMVLTAPTSIRSAFAALAG